MVGLMHRKNNYRLIHIHHSYAGVGEDSRKRVEHGDKAKQP